MNRDIDFKIKRKEELVKRRIKLVKLLITLILLLMLIIFVIKLRTENSYINHIGLNLSKLYSIENYEYKKVYEKEKSCHRAPIRRKCTPEGALLTLRRIRWRFCSAGHSDPAAFLW